MGSLMSGITTDIPHLYVFFPPVPTFSVFVGVRCPLPVVMERRMATWNVGYLADGSVPIPVALWQQLVHQSGLYDLELDTSALSPEECAAVIRQRLSDDISGTAFQRLTDRTTSGSCDPS